MSIYLHILCKAFQSHPCTLKKKQTPSITEDWAWKTNSSQTNVVYHLHGQTGRSTVWANMRKIQDWLISARNRIYHLYKSVPFAEKRPRRPETGIKHSFEEREHDFRFGIFRPEKKTTFSHVSLLPKIFRWKDPKSRVPFYVLTGFYGNFW